MLDLHTWMLKRVTDITEVPLSMLFTLSLVFLLYLSCIFFPVVFSQLADTLAGAFFKAQFSCLLCPRQTFIRLKYFQNHSDCNKETCVPVHEQTDCIFTSISKLAKRPGLNLSMVTMGVYGIKENSYRLIES